jgi:transcriptional regulator with XRE-family HTH domain
MDKLRQWRRTAGLTLAELAAKVGVSEVTMSRYELGTRQPLAEHMLKIEKITAGAIQPADFIAAAARRRKASAA